MVIFAMIPPPTAPGRLRFRKVGKKAARPDVRSERRSGLTCLLECGPPEGALPVF